MDPAETWGQGPGRQAGEEIYAAIPTSQQAAHIEVWAEPDCLQGMPGGLKMEAGEGAAWGLAGSFRRNPCGERALEHKVLSRKKGPVVPCRSVRTPRCKQPKWTQAISSRKGIC